MGHRRGLGGLCGACCSGSEEVLRCLCPGGSRRGKSRRCEEVRCNSRESLLPLLQEEDVASLAPACCWSWRIHKPRFVDDAGCFHLCDDGALLAL